MDKNVTPEIVAVLLAGGQSRRFGDGDKFLKELNGKPMMERVLDRVRPQVRHLLINSNVTTPYLEGLGYPIAADVVQGYAGPLAGILTGMEWAQKNWDGCEWIASFPTDAPFLPIDCVEKMYQRVIVENAQIACAVSAGRTHPVCALWHVSLASDLRQAMIEEEMRKIDLWTTRYRLVNCEFSDQPVDPFFNINRPDDLRKAEEILAHIS